MTLRSKIRCVGLTDTGKVREHNEDTIATDGDIGLLVLADGMGGYNAGEVASGIAVKTIMNLVREAGGARGPQHARSRDRAVPPEHHPARCDPSRQQDHLPDRAHAAAVRGHGHDHRRGAVLRQQDFRSPTWATRACTACAATSSSRSPWITRCCRSWSIAASTPPKKRSGRQTRTTSHARSASSRTSRSRCRKLPVQKGDVYVLCSDGLSDMVEDDDIHLTISTFSANLDTVAKQLIQLANDNGGRDNVSVVMAQVLDAFPAHTRRVRQNFRLVRLKARRATWQGWS